MKARLNRASALRLSHDERRNRSSFRSIARGIGATLALALSSTLLSSCAATASATSSNDGAASSAGSSAENANIDRSFVDTVARLDARALANSRIALRTTGDPVVAAYARSTAGEVEVERDNLQHFANEVGFPYPAADAVAADTALARLRGRSFDRAYLDAERADASRAIDAFRSEIRRGSQRDLAAYALQTLPYLVAAQSLATTDRAYLDDPKQYGELVPLRS